MVVQLSTILFLRFSKCCIYVLLTIVLRRSGYSSKYCTSVMLTIVLRRYGDSSKCCTGVLLTIVLRRSVDVSVGPPRPTQLFCEILFRHATTLKCGRARQHMNHISWCKRSEIFSLFVAFNDIKEVYFQKTIYFLKIIF